MLMSHTSESVPPSLGARFLYWFVSESKTARFETLAITVPSRLLTWVNLPPNQMLVPTCSMARTVPLTIGVWSGVSEGKASATPQAKSIARAIEASSTTILLIPISFFRGRESCTLPPRDRRRFARQQRKERLRASSTTSLCSILCPPLLPIPVALRRNVDRRRGSDASCK